MMKPAVEVVNATVPEKPEAAESVAEKLELPATSTVSEGGVPCPIVPAVTVSVYDQDPLSTSPASESLPAAVYEPDTDSGPDVETTPEGLTIKPGDDEDVTNVTEFAESVCN
jgi:hypothetical protein